MIAVISCKKLKQTYPCSVREMYSKSPLFRSQLEFCELLNYNDVYIMSVKYGLVGLDEVIEPYDLTLSKTLVLNANVASDEQIDKVAYNTYTTLNNIGDDVDFHTSVIYYDLVKKQLNVPNRRIIQGKQATQTMKSYDKAIETYKQTNDLEETFKILQYKKPQRKLNEPHRTWYHPDGRTFYGPHHHLVKEHPNVNLGTAYKVMMTYIGELVGNTWTYHVKGWHLDPSLEFQQVNGRWRLKK